MNRINKVLESNQKILSIYFTAGFPNLNDTTSIIKELEKNGVDMIEIGLPFSDPLADGPTIQASSTTALQNGMTTKVLFDQLKNIRDEVQVPLLIMGYFNPILQYGVADFCAKCKEVGVDGLIIPDLPLKEFQNKYRSIFEANGLSNIFLITPQTSEERIREIDTASNSFIYMVSSASTTGAKNSLVVGQQSYFKRIASMNLNNDQIVGFGISNQETFDAATQDAKGAIIGSAFIRTLKEEGINGIAPFIKALR